MANVPRPNIVWRGAHPNNFTVGRPGAGRDGRNTFHHVVGSAESAVLVFNNGSRQASAHLVITDRSDVAAWQCVDFNDTAWSDGNWDSNLRTISMEHHGDWRNGYRNEQVIENSARIVAWLRDQGLVNRFVRHNQLSSTACPADLVVEEIWNRASKYIDEANKPAPKPQWLNNRQEIAETTIYAQEEGIFVRNLNNTAEPADARRFPINQSFLVKGKTTVDGEVYYITKSSFDGNVANGIWAKQVDFKLYVPPVVQPNPDPPKPTTPDWADSLLVDDQNREMYILRATPLIDLELGRPVVKDGKEVWFQAGDIIKDVSAHTVVSEITYQLTEFSYQKIREGKYKDFGNGIKSSDLTLDPKACPPGTPANPKPAPEPKDPTEHDKKQDQRLTAIETLINTIVGFLDKIFKNWR